jgi:DNA-binding MarR family transcriptional regulator
VPRHDQVDLIISQWQATRPELDTSPIAVIGRISRLSRIIDRVLAENFARHGIESWMYDVLATLRRSGPPFTLTAGQLVERTMVTTGAMTNRIDRLESRGLVTRAPTADRRQVAVVLSATGRQLVDDIITGHLDTEQQILSALPAAKRATLANTLRTLLLDLGDDAPQPSQSLGWPD